jgi:lysophospholipase L1-like esterase
VVLATLAVLIATVTGVAAADRAAAAGKPSVLVVGDSLAETLTLPTGRALLAGVADVSVAGKRCRRTTTPGACAGAQRSTLDELVLRRRTPLAAVVVISGYNDLRDDGPRFARRIDAVLREITTYHGAIPVVWLTLANGSSWFTAQNEALRSAPARWPTLRIADWAWWSASHRDWFVDGVHLGATGARALARFTTAALTAALRVDAHRAAASTGNPLPTGPFALGSSGEGVRSVQRFLAARGYGVGQPDGVFGPRTDRAVRAFQADARRAGVLADRPDGVWGPRTQRAAAALISA